MPGTFVIKPIEAHLMSGAQGTSRMDPFCVFTLGEKSFATRSSQNGGSYPHWSDSVTIPIQGEDTKCMVEIRDEQNSHASFGSFSMDLSDLQKKDKVRDWFTISNNDSNAGDVLMEVIYIVDQPQAHHKETLSDKVAAKVPEVLKDQGLIPDKSEVSTIGQDSAIEEPALQRTASHGSRCD